MTYTLPCANFDFNPNKADSPVGVTFWRFTHGSKLSDSIVPREIVLSLLELFVPCSEKAAKAEEGFPLPSGQPYIL